MRKGKLTDDEKKQAVELLKGGVPSKDVAAKFGVTRQRIGQLEKELEARALEASRETREALKPDKIIPGGAPDKGGGYAGAAAGAGVDTGEPKPNPKAEKIPEHVDPEVEADVDGEQVVEDITELMTGILLAVAMFQDVDLDKALEDAINFSPAEKRRLLNWARALVPYWKKWGTSNVSLFIFFGMFSSMTVRKYQTMDREIAKQQRARARRDPTPPPGTPPSNEVTRG